MGKATGFIEYSREKPKERNPLTRLKDWKEYSTPFSDEMLRHKEHDAWTAPLLSAIWEWKLMVQHRDVQFII